MATINLIFFLKKNTFSSFFRFRSSRCSSFSFHASSICSFKKTVWCQRSSTRVAWTLQGRNDRFASRRVHRETHAVCESKQNGQFVRKRFGDESGIETNGRNDWMKRATKKNVWNKFLLLFIALQGCQSSYLLFSSNWRNPTARLAANLAAKFLPFFSNETKSHFLCLSYIAQTTMTTINKQTTADAVIMSPMIHPGNGGSCNSTTNDETLRCPLKNMHDTCNRLHATPPQL